MRILVVGAAPAGCVVMVVEPQIGEFALRFLRCSQIAVAAGNFAGTDVPLNLKIFSAIEKGERKWHVKVDVKVAKVASVVSPQVFVGTGLQSAKAKLSKRRVVGVGNRVAVVVDPNQPQGGVGAEALVRFA